MIYAAVASIKIASGNYYSIPDLVKNLGGVAYNLA
jgi:hypothetical protein